ncbi:hypothetical protein HPB50_007866 [Hyalomma asiaticum]|uniref:Uncharacterized protein n=1 Tax=Hyalomma asiaticum TaxID=266040 RepID=A0ACB7TG56_HYAAI|nr:hypothetical protein HPB50_007866 [Hyalomma asiaticum]
MSELGKQTAVDGHEERNSNSDPAPCGVPEDRVADLPQAIQAPCKLAAMKACTDVGFKAD